MLAAVLAAGILMLFLLDARAVQSPNSPEALPLTRTFDESPTGFTLNYPEEWQYVIPSLGIMLLGPPETLNEGVPGPSLTVQRAEPLSVVGDLDAALERYLSSGPLRVSGQWEITDAAQVIRFDERDARGVELEGSIVEGGVPMHMRIVVTSADNTFVYLIITMMPLERRADLEPTLEAILATLRILE
jgi:hypothetical protein